jgi:hypothetical protein
MNTIDLVKDEMRQVIRNAGDASGNSERAKYLIEHEDIPAAIKTLEWIKAQAADTEKAAERVINKLNYIALPRG